MTLTSQLKVGTRHRPLTHLRLAVEKVIHHDDVFSLIIIRSWCRIAGCDPNSCDERLIEDGVRAAWLTKTTVVVSGKPKASMSLKNNCFFIVVILL